MLTRVARGFAPCKRDKQRIVSSPFVEAAKTAGYRNLLRQCGAELEKNVADDLIRRCHFLNCESSVSHEPTQLPAHIRIFRGFLLRRQVGAKCLSRSFRCCINEKSTQSPARSPIRPPGFNTLRSSRMAAAGALRCSSSA